MGGLIQQRLLLPLSLLGLLSISGCRTWHLPSDSQSTAWHRQLENWLERGLAHPVELGGFQGFSHHGLAFAATKVNPTPSDPSSLRAKQLFLLPDLVRSLQQRQLVLRIGLKGFEARIIKNSTGQFWKFPRGKGKAPRLFLQLNLLDSATLRINNGEVWRFNQGQLDLDLPNRKLDFQALLKPELAVSTSRLVLRNHWGEGGNLRIQLALQKLPLRSVALFLPRPINGKLEGVASGLLQLNRREGRWQSWGPLRIENFAFNSPKPLHFKGLKIIFSGEQLMLAPSRWRWAEQSGDLAAFASWKGFKKFKLSLVGNLVARGAVPRLKATAELEGAGTDWRMRSFSVNGKSIKGQGAMNSTNWWVSAPTISWRNSQTNLRANLLASGSNRGEWRLERLAGNFIIDSVQLAKPLGGNYRWLNKSLIVQADGPLQLNASWQPKTGRPLGEGEITGLITSKRLNLKQFKLGQPLRGWLVANAEIRGTLQKPLFQGDIYLEDLGYGPLGMPGIWQGKWQSNNFRLKSNFWLKSNGGMISAQLQGSKLSSFNWRQAAGNLTLAANANGYHWNAQKWDLAPLQLQLEGRKKLPLNGYISGNGSAALKPFGISGTAIWLQPGLGPWRGKSMEISGQFRSPGYALKAKLAPGDGSEVRLTAKGAIAGQLDLQASGWRLQPGNIWQVLQSVGGPIPEPSSGKAADLFGLVISDFGKGLDAQLQQLRTAEIELEATRLSSSNKNRSSPENLRGLFDAELSLRGPRLDQLTIAAAARGQIWLEGQFADKALNLRPFVATLQGPLKQISDVEGKGKFSFSGLPLGLLALFTPVPPGLRGSLGGTGKWRSGKKDPQIQVELALEEGVIRDQPLKLERGAIQLNKDALDLDIALRGGAASSSIDLSGRLPLDKAKEGLELRLSSRNDGLIFLAALVRSSVEWRQGSADLQLLVRGSREKPIANGFVRLREAEIRFAGQTLSNLQAALFFDFKRLVFEEFSASIGNGSIEAKGSLPFVSQADPKNNQEVRFKLNNVPIQQANLRLRSDGELLLSGSLLKPLVGGEISISNGRLQLGATQLRQTGTNKIPLELRLPETNWQFQQPLVLLGPTVESSSGLALRQAIPAIGIVRLKDLRLNLGPDLRITAQPVADFSLAGLLTLNGSLGPDIQLSGVVRLLQGRVNVFTSSLRLDNNSPNVAVFTPSLGLIPYLDLALTSRVSDQVRSGERAGLQSGDQLQGNYSNLDRLNLVKVVVRVSGPADRIGDNLELRSIPPLPRERLIALLGGNSLAGLSGGDAGTALVTVLGQTLLTPVVGGFSELLGQRLNVALYPAYLDPYVTNSSTSSSSNRRVPSKLVLGSEVGLDITEKLSLSILAAPNRSDIPPEATLRFQATDNLGLQGSFDQQGRWQSQVQLFFRF